MSGYPGHSGCHRRMSVLDELDPVSVKRIDDRIASHLKADRWTDHRSKMAPPTAPGWYHVRLKGDNKLRCVIRKVELWGPWGSKYDGKPFIVHEGFVINLYDWYGPVNDVIPV